MFKNNNFKTGLMLLAVSGFFIYHTLSKYSIGSASDMGPGYFPLMFSSILAIIGAWLFLFPASDDSSDQDTLKDRKNLVLVLSGIILFGALLTTAGFLIAATVLLLSMVWAMPKQSLRQLAIFSLILIVFSYLVFSRALGLYFPFWPKWIF